MASIEENVIKIFTDLSNAESTDVINELWNNLVLYDSDIQKYKFDQEKYPRLNLSISKEEIEKLKEEKFITDDNTVNVISNALPITKLLYAVLWKQGDLAKIKHIISGIISQADEEYNKGLIFYQFGKHLSNKNKEPIVDQHVLRAWETFYNNTNLKKEKQSPSQLIKGYKKWLNESLRVEFKTCENYLYHIDKLLFAVGKYIKNNETKLLK